MSDESTQWKLDLDLADSASKLEEFKGNIISLGDQENFIALVAGFEEVGAVAAGIGGVIYGLKAIMETAFETESIQAVNKQFEILSENAGLFGEDLKKALEQSAGGLVDETTLLRGAAEAMTGLGANSSKLPQIMTLARQATAVFGGELMANFNGIAQAIESGNTRMLKHLGIVIDQKKAYHDYAESIGVTSGELSKAGQQTAIMNAVIAQGKVAFDGIDDTNKKVTTSWQQMKSAFSELSESITVYIGTKIQPAMNALFKGMASMAQGAKNVFKEIFGTEAEADQVRLQKLSAGIDAVKARIAELSAGKMGLMERLVGPGQQKLMEGAQKSLAYYQKQYDELSIKVEAAAAKEQAAIKTTSGVRSAANKTSQIDMEAHAKKVQEFAAESAKLKEQEIAENIKSAESTERVAELYAQRREALAQQQFAEESKINTKYGASSKEADVLVYQSRLATAAKIKALNNEQEKDEKRALQNYVANNKNSLSAVGAAWKLEAKSQIDGTANVASMGGVAYNALGSSAADAFTQMAEGNKVSADQILKTTMGSIGKEAVARGTFMLLSSIWPPNPLGLAEGAGLIAFGGALLSQSGGGGAATPSVSAGGGAAPAPPETTTPTVPATSADSVAQNQAAATAPSVQTAPEQKHVNLIVQGNLYNNNEARNELMDMMRQATDATDFKYVQVGN